MNRHRSTSERRPLLGHLPSEVSSQFDLDSHLVSGPSIYFFDRGEELHEHPPALPPSNTQLLRLRPQHLPAFGAREGDHFTVLEQSDGSPFLRDFPTAVDLIEFLKEQRGELRALLEPDSAEVLEMQRSAIHENNVHLHDDDTDVKDDAGGTDLLSSVTSLSGITPKKIMWVDVQCTDYDIVETVLSAFPRIEPDTLDDMRDHGAPDTAHWFARHRYLFANVDCSNAPLHLNKTFTLMNRSQGGPLVTGGVGSSMILSLIAFSDVLVTVHSGPFAGHRETLHTLYEVVSSQRRKTAAQLQGVTQQNPATDHVCSFRKRRLTIGLILATLIESITIAGLPDPTMCLAEVDRIDEMVLLITQDQHDLLRRIARVRRELSAQRAKLYRKERFLQTFNTPSLRASFVSATTGEQYRHLLGEIYHVAERLEAARDALTQANSNFVSHISLQVAQTSNHMNTKMKALSQVATICMPLTILTGLMGMNVTVPYNTTAYPDSLVPFFVIVAIMILFLVLSIPLVWRGVVRDKQLHSQSEGMVTVLIDD